MEIKIGKSARTCCKCERAFVHEEDLHSIVRLAPEGLLREDFCRDCWTPEIAESAYSAWGAQFYDPAVAEAQPPEVFSPLRQLFYEAVEGDSRDILAMAYLAAQLLRRQKVFRLIKESDESDGAACVLLFADRIGDRLIEVRDPSLTHAEMELGRQLLVERLAALEEPAMVTAGDGVAAGNGDDEDAERAENEPE